MEAFCPILGREVDAEPLTGPHKDWTLLRCPETGLIFLHDPPEYEELSEERSWDQAYLDERNRRREAHPFKEKCADVVLKMRKATGLKRERIVAKVTWPRPDAKRRRLLDVGCGTGRIAMLVVERFRSSAIHVEPYGVDVSRHLTHISDEAFRPLGGRSIHADAVSGIEEFPDRFFDGVLLHSYLEHETRPLDVLRAVRRVLADGACAYVKVPNYASWNRRIMGGKWCGYRFPEHVSYFTPKTLRGLVKNAGCFDLRQTWIDRFPLNDGMYATLRLGDADATS